MNLELIKMPNFRKPEASGDFRTYRRFIITINDVIVEDFEEITEPVVSRFHFDQRIASRIKTYEIALGVKAKKARGI